MGGHLETLSRSTSHRSNSAIYEVDAWEENIAAYLETQNKITVGMVASSALNIQTPRLGTAEQRRIGAALTRLGWVRLAKDSNGTTFLVAPMSYGARLTTAHFSTKAKETIGIGRYVRKCAVVRRCAVVAGAGFAQEVLGATKQNATVDQLRGTRPD